MTCILYTLYTNTVTLSALNCYSESKIMTANNENRILLLIMCEVSEAEPSDIVTLIIICI